jgi:polyhydroxyalkanoate synthesis regulator phasin
MNKQKMLTAISTVIFTGSALLVVPQIYAQTPGGSHLNFFQELVQFFSQKFGLDKTQVQSALTDFKNQQKANVTPRPTLSPQQTSDREKSRLDQLITGGKITADQETAILNELATLRTKYNLGSQSGLTPDQRKTQMTNMRSEIVSWAQSQGIDSSYVMGGFGNGGNGFRGDKGMGRGWNNGQSEIASPAPTQ